MSFIVVKIEWDKKLKPYEADQLEGIIWEHCGEHVDVTELIPYEVNEEKGFTFYTEILEERD